MPVYLDKKTGRLYIEFQYRGVRHKERLPEGTKKSDAEALEIKLKSDILLKSHGLNEEKVEITFEQFTKHYFGPHALAHYSKVNLERSVFICKAALPFFKGKAMRSIKPADVERFQTYRKNLPTMHKRARKPATVLREMSIISKIFSLAVKNDLIAYNPCSRIERTKFDNIQDKILRYEDEERFFSKMFSEWAKDICRIVLNTGLSRNDLLGLTRFHIDRQARCIRLTRRKTQHRMIIPLNSIAMEIIERRWTNNSPLLFPSPVTGKENGSVTHAMKRACKRADIDPHLTIRDLRRTYASRLEANGTPTSTVAKMLGHSDLRSIHRYERSFDAMREAADLLANPAKSSPATKSKVVKLSKKRG